MSEKRDAKKAAKLAKKEDKKAAKLAKKENKRAKRGETDSIEDALELDGVQYIAEGFCGEDEYSDLSWHLDEDGKLIITGSGYMADYSLDPHFSRPWGAYSDLINTVYIDADVKYIGDFAFYGLSCLSSFDVSPDNRFIAAADGVLFNKDLSELIAYPTLSASEYIVPDTVIVIDEYAFAGCRYLERVIMHDNVSEIGHHAFAYCSELTEVADAWGVLKISDCAFEGCANLKTFETWANVEIIGNCAFRYCSRLSTIKISRRVRVIGDGITDGCDSFEGFEVDEENLYFSAQDGILFNRSASMILSYPVTKTAAAYALPRSVTDIGEYTFAGNQSLANISLPKDLNIIGRYSFAGCDSLSEPAIPENVSYIGEFAFA